MLWLALVPYGPQWVGKTITFSVRRKDIDIARAIAMSLVVLHHLTEFFPEYGLKFADSSTCGLILEIITWIHIPVFVLIAGYVSALGGSEIQGLSSYLSFERKKLFRLILPYIAICSLQLLIKISFHTIRISEVPDVLISMFIAPHAGPMGHGWFLYMLMAIFVVWPLLRSLVNRNRLPLILALLFLFAILPIPWPKKNPYSYYFELERLTWYFPMFVLGYWYYHRERGRWHPGFSGIVIAGCIFVCSFLVRRNMLFQYVDRYSLSMPCPSEPVLSFLLNLLRVVGTICVALSVLWISGKLATYGGRVTSFIARLGLYSYDVYLLHVIVAHSLLVAISRMRINAWESLALLPVVIFCSIAIAYQLGQLIRWFPRLAFVVLGVPLGKPNKAEPA